MNSKMVDYTIMRLGKVITTYQGKASTVIGRCPICGKRGEIGKSYLQTGEFGRGNDGQYWSVRVTHTEEQVSTEFFVLRHPKDVCEIEFPGMHVINASIRETHRAKMKYKPYIVRGEPYIKYGVVFYDSDWPAMPYEGQVPNR